MLYECECCGISKELTDEEFDTEDWEKVPAREETKKREAIPEKILCNLCLEFYTSEHAEIDHSAVHRMWEKFGRPEKFSQNSCLLEEDKPEVGNIVELGEKLFEGLPLSEKRLVSASLTSVHFKNKKMRSALDSWIERPLTPSIW